MIFKKVGALWNSKTKDRNGNPFMNGLIDADVTLEARQKIFVFQTDPATRKPNSPIATIVVGVGEGGKREAKQSSDAMPGPLPDDNAPEF